MQEAGEPITIKSVAEKAGVSRQYLYDNFMAQLEQLRRKTKHVTIEVDGETAVVRSAGRAATIELALRNKIGRLEDELAAARKENVTLKRRYEKALGEAEEWRNRHKNAVSQILELSSKARWEGKNND